MLVFLVLDSLWWTEKMWWISGQKINIFPTSSPRVVNRFPIPTISLHFPQQLSHKLSINQHFPFMFPTPKSTFYPQINIVSMDSWSKNSNTSKLEDDYQHSLNIYPSLSIWDLCHFFYVAYELDFAVYLFQYLRSLPPLIQLYIDEAIAIASTLCARLFHLV